MFDRFQKVGGYDAGVYGDPTMVRSSGGVTGGLGGATGAATIAPWRKKLAGIIGDVGRLFPQDDEYAPVQPLQSPQIYSKNRFQY